MKFLARLLPARFRRRGSAEELSGVRRMQLFSTVQETDPAYLAIMDVLADTLEGNASVAFDPNQPQEKRLIACDRAGIAWQLMDEIEQQRRHAAAGLRGKTDQ